MIRSCPLLVIPDLYKGGAEYQLFELCKSLIKHGIEPQVLTFYSAESLDQIGYYTHMKELGIQVDSLMPTQKTGVSILRKLRSYIRAKRPHVIQSFLSANYYLPFAALGTNARLYLGIRNHIDLGSVKKTVLRAFDWRIQGYIANTKLTGDHFCDQIGAIPEKRHCIYNGIDTARLDSLPDREQVRADLGIVQEARVFVTVSNMHFTFKGHRELLSAWQKHIESHPNDVLILIGGGKLQKDYEAQYADCVRAGNLLFLGMQENPLPYVNAADVYVSPSYIEGFSNSIAEAVLLGKSVIATRVGGTPELLGNGSRGTLIEARDTEALQVAMEQKHLPLTQDTIDSMKKMVSLDHLAQEYLQIWGLADA